MRVSKARSANRQYAIDVNWVFMACVSHAGLFSTEGHMSEVSHMGCGENGSGIGDAQFWIQVEVAHSPCFFITGCC